jgi:cysteine-rich repeat protein
MGCTEQASKRNRVGIGSKISSRMKRGIGFRPFALAAVLISTFSGPLHATTYYSNDFEGSVGPEWSSTTTSATPSGGRKFLGEFSNGAVSLTVNGLPPSSTVVLGFDLYVIRSWDGNADPPIGPDVFDLGITGGATLLHTTFNNHICPSCQQAYPGTYPGGVNPSQTGAVEQNTLGYFDFGTPSDAVYRLTYAFTTSGSSATINFSASGLEPISNESWGLDNVIVSTCGDGTINPGEQCDDGNTVSGDGCSSTCTMECTAATVDSSNRVSVNASSLAINTNGFPIISYWDSTSQDLKVAACTDAGCTSPVISTLDTTGNVGDSSTLVIGADNLPLISYLDQTNHQFKIAHCGNSTCTTGVTITNVGVTGALADDSGREMVLGSDGFGLLTYIVSCGTGCFTEHTVHCQNASCTSSVDHVTNSGPGGGVESASALGTDSRVLSAVRDYSNYPSSYILTAVHCTDVACSTTTRTQLDSQQDLDSIGLVVGSDGKGLIAYNDTTTNHLKVAHCNDTSCTSVTKNVVDGGTNNVGGDVSIAVGSDGKALLSYYDATAGDLRLARCNDVACASVAANTIDNGGDVGRATSIAVTTGGRPYISYVDATNHNLKLAVCGVGCGNGIVDPGEQCDLGASNGSSSSCCTATCQYRAAGQTCRPADGVCDAAETCTGSNASCPADAKLDTTTTCRPAADVCDVAEVCDGVNNTCPTDAFQPSTTVCRPAAGVCDLAEDCTGSSAACPADAKSTATCRPATGVCDAAETCDGVNNNCPADGFQASTTVCRPAAGVCDLAENCTGSSATCPTDAKSTATCRPAAGVCDVAESCDGANNNCPADGFKASSVVCRGAVNECDVAENCTGGGAACPADAVKSAGTACTDDGNPCTTDTCNGSVGSPSCTHPAGHAGAICRAVAGACDVAEVCTGTSTACPADAFQASTLQCRPAAGVCDVSEFCTGSSAACPADAFQPSTQVCRASAGVCDVAENCTGSSAACPADGFRPNGYQPCTDNDPGTYNDRCNGAGACFGDVLTGNYALLRWPSAPSALVPGSLGHDAIADAPVCTDTIHLGKSAQLTNSADAVAPAVSGTAIRLAKLAHISGDAVTGGGNIILGKNAVIDGSQDKDGMNPKLDQCTAASYRANTARTQLAALTPTMSLGQVNVPKLGTQNVVLAPNQNVLDADLITVGRSAILQLQGDPSTTQVIVRVAGNLALKRSAKMLLTGGLTEDKVIFLVDGTAKLGGGAEFHGTIDGSSSVTAGQLGTVYGQLLSDKSLKLSGAATVHHIPFAGW